MQLQAVAESPSKIAADWLILPVVESADQSDAVRSLDAALGERLTQLRESGDWTGKAGECLELREPIAGGPSRLLLIGIGPADKLNRSAAHRNLMTAVRRITATRAAAFIGSTWLQLTAKPKARSGEASCRATSSPSTLARSLRVCSRSATSQAW